MTKESQSQPDSSSAKQIRYVSGYSPATVQYQANRTVARQAAFFLPHLRPGMSLLDCGCGPGTITIGLAQAVAPGQVVGIDIEPNLVEHASVLSREQGISNLRFQGANVFDLPFFEGSFDSVFAGDLLQRLNQPIRAIKEMWRVLKPDGVIGIICSDMGGRIIGPATHGLEDYYNLHERIWRDHGIDMHLGRHLRSLLRQAGFVRAEASVSYDCYGTPVDTRELAQWQIARIKNTAAFDEAVEAGWVDRATLDKMIVAWEKWGENPDAFYAHPKCLVVGWKE
jgi:ubiquinone/menaquinone biosynthesis C-methylase UbiE